MSTSYKKTVIQYHTQCSIAGLSYAEAETLRRAAQTLHTWAEHECNGTITRAEEGETDHRGNSMKAGKTYSVSNINGPGRLHYYRTADRETPALKRAADIAKTHGAELEHQGDPRGWPLKLHIKGMRIAPPCRY